jgi:HSP20 family molecular chaperone IbpA
LSAKWRRNKNPKKFNIFRTFRKTKERDASGMPQFTNSWAKKKVYPKKLTLPKIYGVKGTRAREPLVDVLEENDEIIVIAEFAGFNMENIKTNVKNQRLILSAEALDRKFHKSLNLPKRVIPTTMRTAYKNGVLEIRLKKVIGKKAIDNVAG